MISRFIPIAALSGAMALGASLVFTSCGTVQRTVVVPPHVAGATFVGNQVCYDCHTNITRSFPMSAHARIQVPGQKGDVHGCEACHGPGSLHVSSGGGVGKFITNPGHDPQACYECHLHTKAEFHLPHHHPVAEGKMNCTQCHDPHGLDIHKPADSGLAMARMNEACANCHREQSGVHVFEHEALREGCVSCHHPHGSPHAKMLRERDNNLCLKCHAQIPVPGSGGVQILIGKVDHTTNLRLGGCWSSGCHTAVHGSQVHPRLFY